jgi:hypothetical protein
MPPLTRAVRHGLAATALVLVVCGVVAAFTLGTATRARAELSQLTGRAHGKVSSTDQTASTAEVTWMLPNGVRATAAVQLAVSPPKIGTQIQIGYDPAFPGHAVIPGAELLSDADRASGELTVVLIVVIVVLLASGLRVATRARLTRRPAREVRLRRVRVQAGLLARSWLETEDLPRSWIPVYFDPVLVTLATPSSVRVYGDPRRDRFVAAEIGGTVLYPSGRVVKSEPRGRRVDNPSEVDESVQSRAVTAGALVRQLRADVVLIVPAPVIGLLWSYLDGDGAASWLGASAIMAAVALWLAALRGSDPS